MKPRFLLAVAVALGFAVHGWAQEPIRVPLKTAAFKDHPTYQNLLMFVSRGTERLNEEPAGKVKSKPALQNPTWFRLQLGVRGQEYLAVVDVAKGSASAKLYVDWEGKGEFADIQPIEAVNTEGNDIYVLFSFEPIVLPKDADALVGPMEARARCLVEKEKNSPIDLQIFPRNFVTGSLELPGGVKHTVAFVDGGFAGRFDPQHTQTVMGINLSGKDFFDWRGDVFPVLPMTELVRIGEDFYRVHIEPDGSSATFEKTSPQLGTLDVQCPDMQLFVRSKECVALLPANGKGRWELPAGKYMIGSWSLSRKEGEATWSLQGSRGIQAMNQVEIKPQISTTFPLGTPLALKYTVRPSDNEVSIGLNVTGRAGETYAAGAEKNMRRQDAPRFTISDEKGNKLTEGVFEYG